MKSVVFVPFTPQSQLKKLYKAEIEKAGLPIAIVERAGISLKRQLQKSDPFKSKNCNRMDCFPCTSGGKGSCKSVGVNYNIVCEECENGDGEQIYHGQTSRTGYIRGGEHVDDFVRKRPKSVMWKHCQNVHQGRTEVKFRMDIVGVYKRDAMLRQITEAVRIQSTSGMKSKNGKSEFSYFQLPRMVIEQN